MQDYAPIGIPSFGLPDFGFGISSGMLSILFGVTLVITAIFTIMLFNHWRKYAPNTLHAFKYAAIYSIGTAALLLTLMSLIPLYSGQA